MAEGLGMSQCVGGKVSCCSQSPISYDLMMSCPHCGGGAAPFSFQSIEPLLLGLGEEGKTQQATTAGYLIP